MLLGVIQRKPQLHVLVTTILVVGVLACCAYFVHAWQLARLSKSLLGYAEREQKREDWLRAANYIDQFLRVRPHDVQARDQLATIYAKGASTPAQKKRAVQLHYSAFGCRATATGCHSLACSIGRVAFGGWSLS